MPKVIELPYSFFSFLLHGILFHIFLSLSFSQIILIAVQDLIQFMENENKNQFGIHLFFTEEKCSFRERCFFFLQFFFSFFSIFFIFSAIFFSSFDSRHHRCETVFIVRENVYWFFLCGAMRHVPSGFYEFSFKTK